MLVIAFADLHQRPITDLTVQNNHRSIAAVSWGPNRLDIVGIGSKHGLRHQSWNNPSNISDGSGWTELYGYFISPPTIVSPIPGILLVFAQSGFYGNAQMNFYDGSSWNFFSYPLRGRLSSALVAVSKDPTSVDIFAKGMDNSYLQSTFRDNFQWSDWESLGGDFVGEPAAVAWGPERLDVVGLGTDGSYLWKYWNGTTWSPRWESLGGNFTSPPFIVSSTPGRLTIYGIDENGAQLHKYFHNGAWSSTWANLGGSLATTFAVHISSPRSFDVFSVDKDNVLIHRAWNGTWTPWVKHFGPFASAPAVASWSSNHIDVFGLDLNGDVIHQAWTGDGWSPAISSGENLGGTFISFD